MSQQKQPEICATDNFESLRGDETAKDSCPQLCSPRPKVRLKLKAEQL